MMYPLIRLICVVYLLIYATGCRDRLTENVCIPRLLLEQRGTNYGAMNAVTVKLQKSNSLVEVYSEPLIDEFEINNVELVQVDKGFALLFILSEKGARDLYRASVTHMGSRVVLSINSNVIGQRYIDGAIDDGKFYTFVELPQDSLGQLVLDIKATLVDIHKC